MLEQSPRVTPLLVELYDSHNLYSMARERGNPDSWRTLAAVMVDLLSIPLNERESQLISDVILGLMRQADKDLRLALADKLAVMDNAPLPMILGLVNDDIVVAEPVLRKSPVLQDQDLAYIIQSKTADYWRAIALRPVLSAGIVLLLAETQDLETALRLSKNDGAAFTRKSFDLLAAMAKTDDGLMKALIHRADLPKDIAGIIMADVAKGLKETLQKSFGGRSSTAAKVIDEIVQEITKPAAIDTFRQKKEALADAVHRKKAGQLTVSHMMGYLQRGQIPTFIYNFAVYSRLSPDRIRAYLREENANNLSLLCKACGVAKGDFVNIFLLTGALRRDDQAAFQQETLSRLMVLYDQIDEKGAKKIMAGLQTERFD